MNAGIFKRAILVSACAVLIGGVQAQYNWDIGGHLGAASYLGEFGGKEQTRRDFIWDMQFDQTRWTLGGFARRKLNRNFSLNAGLLYFRLQGADHLSTNPARVGRNLSFRNDMFELYLRPEFSLFQNNDVGGHGRYLADFRLFIYAGGALYYSNPMGQVDHSGEYYSLRKLNTELQDYSSIGVAIPVGIGFHFTMNKRHRFGMDLGWRTTFSDYLDDASTVYADPELLPGGVDGLSAELASQSTYVLDPDGTIPDPVQYTAGSPRGDPTHNDSYMLMTFTYSYVLRSRSNFYQQRYSWTKSKKRYGRKSRAKF